MSTASTDANLPGLSIHFRPKWLNLVMERLGHLVTGMLSTRVAQYAG
jgi:hypothetical protein